MALNNMGLGFVFTARDLASVKIAKVERHFKSLDDRVTGGANRMDAAFSNVAKGMALFTGGAAAVAGTFALANAAGEFEQQLAAVQAVTNATSEDLEKLRSSALSAGLQSPFSPTEAVEGLLSLSTAGQTAQQSMETLMPVLNLATASLGQLSIPQAAEAIVGTLNAYEYGVGQAKDTTDKLLRITQLTNFQTRDFEIGLSKAAATGAVFGQKFEDVLIMMGLLRNRNIDASSSATAVRESIRRVGAEKSAIKALSKVGISSFDQDGNLRSVIDVMMELKKASVSLTEKEQSRTISQAFGARGLLAYNAISKATFTTMVEGKEVYYQGAEAIRALRTEMEKTQGTAKNMKDRMLDTFQGQKTLLGGSMQTLAVSLGEPFAHVFKPILETAVTGINALIRGIRAIPMPIKKAAASLAVGAGGLMTLVGGAIAAKGAMALAGAAMSAMGVTLGGLLLVMGPVILGLSALGGLVATVKLAIDRDLGGIGSMLSNVRHQGELLYRGFSQLFSQGGFSGNVLSEFEKVENQGLERFAIRVYQIGFRVQRIWEGVSWGFNRAIRMAEPVFVDFKNAISGFGSEISAVFLGAGKSMAELPSSEFALKGESLGETLAGIVSGGAKVLSIMTRVGTGLIQGFRATWQIIHPVFVNISNSLSSLRASWNRLIGGNQEASKSLEESADNWKYFGKVISEFVGGMVWGVTLLVNALVSAVSHVVRFMADIQEAYLEAEAWISNKLGITPSPSNPERASGVEPIRAAGPKELVENLQSKPSSSLLLASVQNERLSRMEAQLSSISSRPSSEDKKPLVVHVQVDGETILRAVQSAEEDHADRSFTPIPIY